jgi:hypothetical protein
MHIKNAARHNLNLFTVRRIVGTSHHVKIRTNFDTRRGTCTDRRRSLRDKDPAAYLTVEME